MRQSRASSPRPRAGAGRRDRRAAAARGALAWRRASRPAAWAHGLDGRRAAGAPPIRAATTRGAIGHRGGGAVRGRRPRRVGPAAGRAARALAPVLSGSPTEPTGRIARYALGTDYHVALRARLEALAADLGRAGLPARRVAYVDDRPLAERALAARAGLGWIGKNTNLLTHAARARGSSSARSSPPAELPGRRAGPDLCGPARDACPAARPAPSSRRRRSTRAAASAT